MFSTFIDEAILKMNEPAPIETPFEFRLRTLKERFGESLVRTPTYEPTAMIEITDKILTGRLKKADVMVSNADSLQNLFQMGHYGQFTSFLNS